MVSVSANSRRVKLGDQFGIPIVNEIEMAQDLAPIGDTGLYYMPEAVDPRNCERYPDSIFCGGQPFSNEFIGLKITPTIDLCGRISVKVDSRLFFGALPEQEFQYVPPGCRNPPPKDTTPRLSGEERRFGAGDFGHMRDDKKYIIALDDSRHSTLKLRCGEVGVGVAKVRQWGGIYPDYVVDEYPRTTIFVQGIPVSEVYRCKIYRHVPASREPRDTVELGEIRHSHPDQRPFLISGKGGLLKRYLSGDCGIYSEEDIDFNPGSNVYPPPYMGPSGPYPLFIAKTKELETCREQNSSDPPSPNGGDEPCDCMACCPNNDELLQKLLKEIQKANKAIGSDEFPATLPKNLTADSGVVTIPNLAQLGRQQVIYLDETAGEYPVKVTIEDTDPTKEGLQSETLEFGNASELQAEQFGVAMNTAIDVNLLVQLVTKVLIEQGITRKQVHTSQSQIEALLQHQGFTIKETLEDVPFTFTVPQSETINNFRLEEFVKESNQKVEVIKFTGKNTYQEDSAILRHLHGMFKGVFFRQVASGAASIAGEISKLLRKQNDAIDKISDNSLDDFDAWAEDFENGFASGGYSGTQLDPAKPFGIDYAARPRIRRLTKPTDQNAGTGQ